MAKTNEEIGKTIRDIVSKTELKEGESILTTTIIVNTTVSTQANVCRCASSQGYQIQNYNKENETIVKVWG